MEATTHYDEDEVDVRDQYRYEEQEEQQEEEEEQESKRPSNVGKYIVMGLLAVLLIASAAANYFLFNDKESLMLEKAKETQRFEALLAQKEEVIKQLDSTKAVIESYQTDNANLQNLLTTANEEISKKQRSISRLSRQQGDLNKFQTEISEAKTLMETLNGQIKTLTDEIAAVKAENETLKSTITTLEQAKKGLAEKIESATGLQAVSIKVESMARKKGDKFEFTNKAKKTNRIAISFELSTNKLSKAGSRAIHMIIINPKGDIMTDEASTEKFMINGSEESVFTRTKAVEYNNGAERIFFNWDETEEYAKGTYKVDIYCDGIKVGSSEVVLI